MEFPRHFTLEEATAALPEVYIPARAAGTEIFLCWRLGEDAIRFWHGTSEGYAGRKPLTLLPGGAVH